MISFDNPLNNIPNCPQCSNLLEYKDWLVVGMRNLAMLNCESCDEDFVTDLPAGFGIYYSSFMSTSTGDLYGSNTHSWYSQSLQQSFENKNSPDPEISISERTNNQYNSALVLNCIDINYGHSVFKLLNYWYYTQRSSDIHTLVIVPSILSWLVPDQADEIWSVELDLSKGNRWCSNLNKKLKSRLSQFENSYLAEASPYPKIDRDDIQAFTGYSPFKVKSWIEQPLTVTYIWRNVSAHSGAYRLWCSTPYSNTLARKFRGILNMGADTVGFPELALSEQNKRAVKLGEAIRERVPSINYAIAGLGERRDTPIWIDDLRISSPSAADERRLCEQYANSHIVVGTHGSGMVLPSAHAGSAVSLTPRWKWSNIGDDFLRNIQDDFLRYHTLPISMQPDELSDFISSLLLNYPKRQLRQESIIDSQDLRKQEAEFEAWAREHSVDQFTTAKKILQKIRRYK